MDNKDYNLQDDADLTPLYSSSSTQSGSSASFLKGGIAGLSFLELALLGAAGFVIFKNRARIQEFLEDHGFDVDAMMTQTRSLIQSKR